MAKHEKYASYASITTADILVHTGLRPLTASESRRLGYQPGARFTSQKKGVKKLLKDKTVSRRQALQTGQKEVHGVAITLEKKAAKNYGRAGFTRRNSEYRHLRDLYIEQKYGKITERTNRAGKIVRVYPVNLKEVNTKSDKEFARLYKEATLKQPPRDVTSAKYVRITKRKLAALRELTGEERFDDLLAKYRP
jgi:hypothetical protein